MRIFRWMMAVLPVLSAGGVAAEEQLHFAAHATQGFLRSDGFRFDQLGLEDRGSWKWTLYALRAEMETADRIRLLAEMAGERIGREVSGEESSDTAALTPHFATAAGAYEHADWLKAAAGIQRIPLGLYNEYRYVGLAYESTILPAMYLKNIGFIAESYRGASVSGSKDWDGRSIQWKAWTGEFEISQYFTSRYAEPREVKSAFGGKLVFSEWIEGLDFGATGYFGQDYNYDRPASSDLVVEPRKQVDAWTAFLRYQGESGLGLRGEYAESNGMSAAYYALASYYVTDWLRPFVMYDRFNTFRYHPQRNYHDAWHIGLNLIPVPAWVLKLEVQRITGNILDNNQPDPGEADGAIYGSVSYSYY